MDQSRRIAHKYTNMWVLSYFAPVGPSPGDPPTVPSRDDPSRYRFEEIEGDVDFPVWQTSPVCIPQCNRDRREPYASRALPKAGPDAS